MIRGKMTILLTVQNSKLFQSIISDSGIRQFYHLLSSDMQNFCDQFSYTSKRTNISRSSKSANCETAKIPTDFVLISDTAESVWIPWGA